MVILLPFDNEEQGQKYIACGGNDEDGWWVLGMNEKVVQCVCYSIEQVACVASGSSSLYLYDVESLASVPRQVRDQHLPTHEYSFWRIFTGSE
jgi:hypothetical protein